MIVSKRLLSGLALLLLTVCFALPAAAQDKPPTSIVSIYHVAPGKQLDFLKWMAAREAVDKEAGVASTQWYAHMEGDSWDYVGIAPDIDDATADKIDEMQRKRGLKTGARGGLEFRSMISSHTDTIAAGPITAAQMVKAGTAP